MEREDAELVRNYLSGESQAFTVLVERYVTSLYSFVGRLCSEKEAVADIVQEVFVKAWKSLHKYKPTHSFRSWIFAIARNTTIDWWRKRKYPVFSEFDNENTDTTFEESLIDTAPLASEIFDARYETEQLEKAISKLSLNDRTLLLLHETEDMSFEEIALIVKKPMNTVKSQYRRALEKLRLALGESI